MTKSKMAAAGNGAAVAVQKEAEAPAVTQMALNEREGEWLIGLPDGRLFGRTRNYAIFELDGANRQINQKKLDDLVKRNRAKDLLAEYPITVYDKGGRWVILDGQHRRAMAEINDRWLYFVVSAGMTIEDVAEANSAQGRWTTGDFLHHWVARGAPEYIRLRSFIDRHPWMTINTAKDMTSYGDRKKVDFAGGNYEANDLEFAEEVARFCESLAGLIDWWRETTFVYAIAMCFEHEGFDPRRLLHKMRQQQGALGKRVNVEQYMALFDEIYNYQMRVGNRLRLEKLVSNSPRRREDRRYRRARGGA